MKQSILLIGLLLVTSIVHAQDPTYVILKEWAAYAGETDSTFKSPTISDEAFTYVATTVLDSVTGLDIRVIKYDQYGAKIWSLDWNGSGSGRDMPADIAIGKDSMIYVCGTTYTSSTNDFDYVILCVSFQGTLRWSRTFNGTASQYDVATSITVRDTDVFVTGVTFSTGTLLDYHTIRYDWNGNVIWQTDFDYNSLMDIPFELQYSDEDTLIIVTGGSQYTLQDWDYQTIGYSIDGGLIYQNRVSGSATGFDRAQAVTTDDSGYVYITGGTKNSDYDIKTAKFDKYGNLIWVTSIDHGGDDLATDILVNHEGNVFICGTSKNAGNDFYTAKLNGSNGHEVWYNLVADNGMGSDDTARAMCFDSFGNIIVTGQVANDGNYYDFYTVAYNADGDEQWHDVFDGTEHIDDNATDISSDINGNIFVTGQVNIGGEQQTVTIKYRSDYFLQPPVIDTPSYAYYFYRNEGQILDLNDSDVTDSLHYYTLHYNPQLFFGFGVMNMVWSHLDEDTSTTDTLQRVDITFLNSTNVTEAYPSGEDTTSHLNYYLAQCANGITNVYGNQSLVYTDVWSDIDVMYSSNNAGLKIVFICNPGSNPNEIGLLFNGQNNLTIDQNWFLQIISSIGNYSFEKPRVYQVDTSGNRIQLNWQLSWIINNSNEALFNGFGTYDTNLPLMIEIGNSVYTTNSFQGISYSTYIGGTDNDDVFAV